MVRISPLSSRVPRVSSTYASTLTKAAWWLSTSQSKTRLLCCQDRVRVVSSSLHIWIARESSLYQRCTFEGTRGCCLRWRSHPCPGHRFSGNPCSMAFEMAHSFSLACHRQTVEVRSTRGGTDSGVTAQVDRCV